MVAAPEKVVLAHWYYSVAEWEQFVLAAHKKAWLDIVLPSLITGCFGLMIIRFFGNASWPASLVISPVIAIVYGVIKYSFRLWKLKWRDKKIPEIEITDYMVIINDKLIVFQGKGKMLRKVDIREENDINILGISYEYQSGDKTSFNELRIPVPRGRLREAIEVQQCLNLRKNLLSQFS
jgi:hypothetical protein